MVNAQGDSHGVSFQRQPEAGTLDHLGLVCNQSVQRKREHIDSHCASKPGKKK